MSTQVRSSAGQPIDTPTSTVSPPAIVLNRQGVPFATSVPFSIATPSTVSRSGGGLHPSTTTVSRSSGGLHSSTTTASRSSGGLHSNTTTVSRSSKALNPSTSQSPIASGSAKHSPDPAQPLSAGAVAGIGIAVLILLLAAVGGIVFFLWKRRRLLPARAGIESALYGEEPQLENTSVIPQNGRFDTTIPAFGERQEVEVLHQQQTSSKSPAELNAGLYSNRHELEARNG